MRLLLVSVLRNENRHVNRLVEGVAAQTRPPDLWLVVDDGSEDGTKERLLELAPQLPFMRVLRAPALPGTGRIDDRLAEGAEVQAFNWALKRAAWSSFSHVGKLDGDIELEPNHFEVLLKRFQQEPLLGIAGADLIEPARRGWKRIRVPPYHVHGAVKLYSRECLLAIGGLEGRLGWDTIDETYARMSGFRTGTFVHVVARHHRPCGHGGRPLRGHARYGECAYTVHYPVLWVAARSLKVATGRPFGVAGVAFLYGYLRALARRRPRVADEGFRQFVRRELRGRVIAMASQPASASGRAIAGIRSPHSQSADVWTNGLLRRRRRGWPAGGSRPPSATS